MRSWSAARAASSRARGAFAGVWLIALLVAVFPANVFMAVHADRFSIAPLLLWLRLPLQAVFVAVVWWALLARRR